jgi:hypothetical protein
MSSAPNAASSQGGAIGTAAMLAEEAAAVHGASISTGKGQAIELNQLNSAALCLSGGGIRSASFALGVIQALASHRFPATGSKAKRAEESLLAHFHYLSTVSGGGFCGGWLSAWLSRRAPGADPSSPPVPFGTIWRQLFDRPEGPDREPKPISWLRENSNYLTPKAGLTSADTWAALTIVIRNLILNWLVILPVVVLIVLLLKAVLSAAGYVASLPRDLCWLPIALLALGAVLLVLALRFATRNRPTRLTQGCDQDVFRRSYLIPAVLSAIVISFALVTPCVYKLLDETPIWGVLAIGALCGFAIYGVSWLLAWPKARNFWDWLPWAVSGIVYGLLVALGAWFYFKLASMTPPDLGDTASSILWPFKWPVILMLVAGTPYIVISQLLGEMLFIGATSYESESDGDREWFGRAGGFLLSFSLAWIIFMFLVLVGSDLATAIAPKVKTALLGMGGISGLITALLGKSSWTPANQPARGKKQVSANLVLAIAACVFVIILFVGISWLLDSVLFGRALSDTDLMRPHVTLQGWPPVPGEVCPLAIAAAVVAAIGIAAWFGVNVNRFSLHALYRNRLIRAYLGASNRTDDEGYPSDMNPFTKFAQSDNLRMHELWSPSSKGPLVATDTWRPFHVINMTLNIASTKRLAWQERKAEPFTVTPLHSGSSCKLFRSSRTYGDKKGISLGTAVAISGAAASPNMGYHSSAPLSLLLAFFNVRLGWWLGNPGEEGNHTYWREGPRVAIEPFRKEIFGKTTDDYKYVYLSDGGHFDNLGLYEMVRRRCRVIVVSDAGGDPEYAFADLGSAVRKIFIDLGVRIDFGKNGLEKLRRRPAKGRNLASRHPIPPRYAVGLIDYPAADGEKAEPGIVVYIKPSYFGTESAGVRNYATAHPEFPHESTGDQWFSESQLEAYRALGEEIMNEVLNQAETVQHEPSNKLGDFFGTLRDPNPAAGQPQPRPAARG